MSRSKRRHFTAEQKGQIPRRHLGDEVPVSDLCDEYGIHPSLFCTCQRQLLANTSAALEDGRTRRDQKATATRDQEKIEALEAKVAKKDSVIAEISEEYVEPKKVLGRVEGTMGTARHPRFDRGLRPGLGDENRVACSTDSGLARSMLECSASL